MHVALFCHSLLSDWNHGNAHFLRGVVTELAARGHSVRVFEPHDAWSVANLVADHGASALDRTRAAFPHIDPIRYHPERLDLDEALDGCSLVLAHEWNDPALVRRVGAWRAKRRGVLALFHDTHHRSVTEPDSIGRMDLSGYDGVLAFGNAVRDVYQRNGWGRRAFTWHEAADVRVFFPRPRRETTEAPLDLVWVGNWGDDERTRELHEFLLGPASELRLAAEVFGVRYPDEAKAALERAGIRYRGWLANYEVPSAFARARFTVHVPRRAYVEQLPGIPTIRPFEALACGIPLVSSPWTDAEGLFTPGRDFLVAHDGAEMKKHARALLSDAALREAVAAHGLETIRARHTCGHRVDELLALVATLSSPSDGSGTYRAPVHPSATETNGVA